MGDLRWRLVSGVASGLLLTVLLALLPVSAMAQAQEAEFLAVDEAFSPSVQYDGRELVLRWRIAPGYYLYQSRIAVEVAGEEISGRFVSEPELKEDPWFGQQAVFHERLEWRAPLTGADTRELRYRYQGCAEAGLCYPPQTRVAILAENPADGITADTGQALPADDAAQTGEAQWLAGLLAEAGLPLILGTFFLLGLGLTFTPCVLPMVPILSSIIVGQGSQVSAGRGFSLSLAYVLGMAATYTTLGVTVGYLGARANLQAAMQQPWLILVFAGLFVALALAMFGLYEIQLPAALRDRLERLGQRSRGGQWFGVGLMGLVSALVVSPCVSAPLAGALLYISTTGDAVIGGGALFAMAMGMGVPLLAIGTTGARLLPRAGAWMERVKQLFGLGLLVVALGLLERILPQAVMLGLWGALLLWCGIQIGTLKIARSGWAGTGKTLGLLLSVWGVLLVVGAARGDGTLFQPLAGFGTATARPAGELFEVVENIEALEARLVGDHPVMVDVYADWCVSCKVMDEEVFQDPRVAAWSDRVRFVKFDVTGFSARQKQQLEQWRVPGPPAVLFFPGKTADAKAVLLGESSLQAVERELKTL